MSKLFACMCNQPQRLSAALAAVRATLVAEPPVSRWGLAYSQSGDVLLVRTPKASDKAVDLAAPLADIATDCAIAQSVRDSSAERVQGSSTDNTPPYRFRRWMFAMTGNLDVEPARLLEHVPEYLRRNIKGRSGAELVFHVFLAMLHDEGAVDDPNLAVAATRRALAATLKLVAAEVGRTATAAPAPLGNVALSNGRSMVLARTDEPLRLRRLWVNGERGERDESFRGVLLVSGGDGDPRDGFEDVPAQRAVLVTRDLQVSLADLAP
jgi:predicted glutamine amidotransferase